MCILSEITKRTTLQTDICVFIKSIHKVLLFWGLTIAIVFYGMIFNSSLIIVVGLFFALFSTNILTAYEIAYDYKNKGCSKIILKCVLNTMIIAILILGYLILTLL